MDLGSAVAINSDFGSCGCIWKEAAVCLVSFCVDRWLEAFVCFEFLCSYLLIGIFFGAASAGVIVSSSSPGCCYRQ